MDIFEKSYKIDADEIQNRINQIIELKLTATEKIEIYRRILGMIDLTTLDGTDNNQKISSLCEQAKAMKTAAVCVYPPFVAYARQELGETEIQVASVAGAFPSGQSPIEVKLAEISYAIEQGAHEIDMVISRGKFLEGDYQTVYDEIAAISSICEDVHLKVILETGELKNLDHIRRASDIAISAGADFIKTSTGKIQPAATTDAFLVMLDAIKTHHQNTGVKIGIKPAGGISEPEQAIPYYLLVKEVLGNEWLNSKLFRFGASRLAKKIVDEINAN
jgi:deoxyribose-phosphate aldolase